MRPRYSTALLAVLLAAVAFTSTPMTSAADAATGDQCRINNPSSEFVDDVAQDASSAQVWRLYQSIYLRQPRQSGFNYWVALRQSGVPLTTIARSFMDNSDEFANRYGDVSDRQFVRLVFNNVLCREPVDAGLDYWSSQLRSGSTRSDVLLNFTELHEYMRVTSTCFSASGVSQSDLDHCDPDYEDRLFEQQVIDLTNQVRQNAGCDPLISNPLLHNAALAHSVDMATNGYLDHLGLDGSNPGDRISRTGYDFRGWAENIALGYRSAAAVMDGWMTSEGHRSNILNCGLQEIGIGHHNRYWTQKFGIPR